MRSSTIASWLLMIFAANSYAQPDEQFAKIKDSPNALYAFFKSMPKGGELHYHYAGSAYAEAMLQPAIEHNYCIDPVSLEFNPNNGICYGVTANQIKADSNFYNKIIRAWSLKDFIPGKESGSNHFFASFAKFNSITQNFQAPLLAEIIKHAASQNELYLEIIMFTLGDKEHYGELIHTAKTFDEKKQILLNDAGFQAQIKDTINAPKQVLSQTFDLLKCSQNADNNECELKVKFQFFVRRNQPLDEVFAQALAGFTIAAESNDIVGVNLVEPEDGILSLKDYDEHMQIFNYMHKLYPKVHIALHAGELALGDVKPSDLNFHINHAIFKGKAERIGHGVDLAYETNSAQTLKYMSQHQIPVEINLTSNQAILKVFGKQHPLTFYLDNHVPVVLSTDDEGILRTDLTQQYVKAVMEHNLDYATIININRNALTYSFLPGKSIWLDPAKAIPVQECQDFNSDICKNFVKDSEKAALQLKLEHKLNLLRP